MSVVFNQDHVVTTCGSCGIQFTVPSFLHGCREKNGGHVWCPNGHQLTVPQLDEVLRLKRELSNLKVDLEAQVRLLGTAVDAGREKNEEILHLNYRIASLRGSNTSLRRKLNKELKTRGV